MHVLWEFSHLCNPPRKPKESALCSKASPLSCEPESGHRYARAGQAGNKFELLSCALAGPSRDGEQPSQAPQGAGCGWEVSNSYAERPTNQGLTPCQLQERNMQNLQRSLARLEQVPWAHLSHAITIQSSTTVMKEETKRKAWERVLLSGNPLLNYAEDSTSVYSLLCPSASRQMFWRTHASSLKSIMHKWTFIQDKINLKNNNSGS